MLPPDDDPPAPAPPVIETLLATVVGAVLTNSAGLGGAFAPEGPAALRLRPVARHRLAVEVAFPPDGGPAALVGQDGLVVRRGARRPFLDLRGRTAAVNEQGLLSLAFHPRWPRDPRVFVHHTDPAGDTRVAEYRRTGGRWTRRVLLAVDQPYANHNGGELAWAPDGRLLVGLGDGGGAWDRHDRSQDPELWLGKLVALHVDGPPRPRRLALGLRNPWRISVDPVGPAVWIADVGQDAEEEISRLPLDGRVVRNFGWPRHEGRTVHAARRLSPVGRLTGPEYTYPHPQGCSVVGGGVPRGPRAPAVLVGRYVFGDFCRGGLASFPVDTSGRSGQTRWEGAAVPGVVDVSVAPDGRVWVVRRDGVVLAVEDAPPAGPAPAAVAASRG